MTTRTLTLVFATAVLSTGACVLDREGLLEGGIGGSGGIDTTGGGGTTVTCATPDECPGQDDDCSQRTCEDGLCGANVAASGTPCEGGAGQCDGNGTCLLDNGANCTDESQCASGFCADGACCDTPCDGECQACGDASPRRGTCTVATVGTDPEMECGTGGTCDGTTGCADGEHIFSVGFGPNGGVSGPLAVTVDASGNVIVAGQFTGTVDFGDGAATATGADGFVIKLDDSGVFQWARTFPGAGNTAVNAIAADSNGAVVACGEFDGSADLGNGAASSLGMRDMFVLKLDDSGNHLWERRFGDVSDQRCTGLDTSATDGVIFAGGFEGAVDFGMGIETSAGSKDIVVGELASGTGTTAFITTAGDLGDQAPRGLSVTGGDIWLCGDFLGNLDFGGNPMFAGNGGASDAFVAKLDATGNHQFSVNFGGADSSNQFATGIATTGGGGVAVVGFFAGTVDFGGGPRAASGGDGYVVTLDSAGQYQWDLAFGDPAPQRALGVAVDAVDNVIITGDFEGTIDLGGGPLSSSGSKDLFLAKYDPTGVPLFSFGRGDVQNQIGLGVASGPSGQIATTGRFQGFFSFGGAQLDGNNANIYLAILEP